MNSTVRRAARFLVEAVKVMRAKDQDYGDAWKELSIASHLDRIQVKVTRIRRLRANGFAAVSEGVRSEVIDIINYAVFIALALEDEESGQGDQGIEGQSSSGFARYAYEAVAGSPRPDTQVEPAGETATFKATVYTVTPSRPLGTFPAIDRPSYQSAPERSQSDDPSK